MKLTEERLEQLRKFAKLEREALLEFQARRGEDPLVTLAHLPSIDELVVLELRDEMLAERGLLAEFSLARLAATGSGEEALAHHENADRVERSILREIAADNPSLTVAVWDSMGRLEPHG